MSLVLESQRSFWRFQAVVFGSWSAMHSGVGDRRIGKSMILVSLEGQTIDNVKQSVYCK